MCFRALFKAMIFLNIRVYYHFQNNSQDQYLKGSLKGVFSGSYFPVFGLKFSCISEISVFSPNKGKYEPEKTLYLDTFHAVNIKPVCHTDISRIRYSQKNN